jgi:hypothetical protein
MITTGRIGLAAAGLVLAALLLLLPAPGGAAQPSGRSSAPANAGYDAASDTKTAPLRLTLELQPTDVTLSEGTSPVRRLFLVAHGSDKALIGGAKLRVDPPDGITARVTDAPTGWPRSGDLVWTIEVGIDNARSAGGKLVALLTYKTADNLSSHKTAGVAEAITAQGAQLVYLPPYSPDLNPIEQAFAKFKAALRHAAERTREGLWQTIGRTLDRYQPQECRNFFKNAGYAI